MFLVQIIAIFTIYAHAKLNIPCWKQLNILTHRICSWHIISGHVCFSSVCFV